MSLQVRGMYRGEYRLRLAKTHSEWAIRSNEPDDIFVTGNKSNKQLLEELDLLLQATDVCNRCSCMDVPYACINVSFFCRKRKI